MLFTCVYGSRVTTRVRTDRDVTGGGGAEKASLIINTVRSRRFIQVHLQRPLSGSVSWLTRLDCDRCGLQIQTVSREAWDGLQDGPCTDKYAAGYLESVKSFEFFLSVNAMSCFNKLLHITTAHWIILWQRYNIVMIIHNNCISAQQCVV